LGALFIVSAEEAAGKTTLCAGLAVNYANDGRKVGYIKTPGEPDGDTAFMKQIPKVEIVTNNLKGYDVVLIEGRFGASAGDNLSEAAYTAAREAKARVIAVEIYADAAAPKFPEVYQGFGANFLGVVINKVPESQFKRVRAEAEAQFKKAGVKLLGVIPENRVLLAITIGELAVSLGGKILNSAEKAEELVENYMLGALVVDSGLGYFTRKSRKAAIIRYDRADMQLAALETATACLVLGGSPDVSTPLASVLYKAESRGIPIIATGAPLNDIVTMVDNTIFKARLDQIKKLPKLAETVKQNLDIKALN